MNTVIRELGLQDYESCYKAMQGFTAQRIATQANELWLVEHPSVFTQGLGGKPEHILDAGNIPVIQTDRGGQVTYHCPGQLVVYLLLDINELKLGAKDYVYRLEQGIINFLNALDLNGERKAGAPGVYVNNEKVAALGIRIKRGYTYHGIAININNDLSAFRRINPCGYMNQKVTSLANLNCDFSLEASKPLITQHLLNVLNLSETTEINNDKTVINNWAA